MDKSGAAKTGWLNENGKWYWLDPVTYTMAKNTWIADGVNNLWYFVDQKGVWTKTSDQNPVDQTVPSSLTTNESVAWIQNEPFALGDQGWIVEVKGLYGLLQPDGIWLVEPEYEKVQLRPYVSKETDEGRHLFPDGFTAEFMHAHPGDGVWVNSNGICPPIAGLGGYNPTYPVVKDGRILIYNPYEKTLSDDLQRVNTNPNYTYYAYPYQDAAEDQISSYYLWNPGANRIFGPYAKNTKCSLRAHKTPNGHDLTLDSALVLWSAISAPFIVQNADGTWSLYSRDTKFQSAPYPSISVTSPDSALAYNKDGSFVVLDGEGKAEYTSKLDGALAPLTSGSAVIHGRSLVQYNGVWYLMSLYSDDLPR